MRKHPPCPPCAGWSLVEALVAVCIAAMLAAAAVPATRSLGRSAKLASFANGFLSHLQLARSEAINRRGVVVMCKSADARSCAAGGGWDQGWIVFHDTNANAARDPGESVLQKAEALPRGFRFGGNLNVARYVAFVPTGATRTSAGAFQAGTLTVCPASPEATEARQVIINAVGRPRIQKVTVDRCV